MECKPIDCLDSNSKNWIRSSSKSVPFLFPSEECRRVLFPAKTELAWLPRNPSITESSANQNKVCDLDTIKLKFWFVFWSRAGSKKENDVWDNGRIAIRVNFQILNCVFQSFVRPPMTQAVADVLRILSRAEHSYFDFYLDLCYYIPFSKKLSLCFPPIRELLLRLS